MLVLEVPRAFRVGRRKQWRVEVEDLAGPGARQFGVQRQFQPVPARAGLLALAGEQADDDEAVLLGRHGLDAGGEVGAYDLAPDAVQHVVLAHPQHRCGAGRLRRHEHRAGGAGHLRPRIVAIEGVGAGLGVVQPAGHALQGSGEEDLVLGTEQVRVHPHAGDGPGARDRAALELDHGPDRPQPRCDLGRGLAGDPLVAGRPSERGGENCRPAFVDAAAAAGQGVADASDRGRHGFPSKSAAAVGAAPGEVNGRRAALC